MSQTSLQFPQPRILVLDDKLEVTQKISALLENEGFTSIETMNYIGNLQSIEGYDLIICDIVWPEKTRSDVFDSDYVGFDIMEYVLGTLGGTKIILMSQSTYDLGKIEKILRAHGYFSLRDSGANIVRVIHQVMSRNVADQTYDQKSTTMSFSQSIFHGPVIVTGTNQGVILDEASTIVGDVIDNLNILEKMILQAYEDEAIAANKAAIREIQLEIAEMRLEAQKKSPDRERFHKFIDVVKKLTVGCSSLLKFINAFQEVIKKIWPL